MQEEQKGRAGRATQTAVGEKIGVPRLHGIMLPGNSFPQICVVSGNIMWKSINMHKSTYGL
jgi:hypothetical protein